MKTESRIVVALALLVVMLVAGAAGAAGHAAQWTVLDPGAVIGADGGAAFAGRPGLSVDLGNSLGARSGADQAGPVGSLASGAAGLLIDHDLVVAVGATFLWVGIGIWAIRRSYRGRSPGDGAAGQGL